MLKKSLILAVAVAIGVSPLLPRVFADSGSWSNTTASSAWDYGTYRVERLALDGTSGLYNYNDAVFVTTPASVCTTGCDLLDVTLFKNGEQMQLQGVDAGLVDAFWHTAQDGRFLYYVPSDAGALWGSVYEYHAHNGTAVEVLELAREQNGLSFLSFATDGDQTYITTLQSNEQTGDIESALTLYDLELDYYRNDFTYTLTAPWQEILDVQDGLSLVKLQFDTGNKQLWLVNQAARQMSAIPGTWTDVGGDIVGGQFLSDGSVQFFMNYRLYRYHPATDSTPREASGATLSWNVALSDAIQIVGDRMAYIDAENNLYTSDIDGVRSLGLALNGQFNLDENAIYFQNRDGAYVGYNFSTKSWETNQYLVTDTYEDIRVGIDQDGNIWYENLTTGYLLNIGYGTEPVVLSDREHAYWQGADGNIYEVTFSPVLDLTRANTEAFRAYNTEGIYMVSNGSMWLIPDPTVYFTWFDSWGDTLEVSQATIDAYLNTNEFKGDLKLAPGTRVKAEGSSRVYVVGNDGKLHWITAETVANDIYGSTWNQGIIEVSSTYLWKYANGSNVSSKDDVRSI